jgi:hypothetical protein
LPRWRAGKACWSGGCCDGYAFLPAEADFARIETALEIERRRNREGIVEPAEGRPELHADFGAAHGFMSRSDDHPHRSIHVGRGP